MRWPLSTTVLPYQVGDLVGDRGVPLSSFVWGVVVRFSILSPALLPWAGHGLVQFSTL